MSYNKINNGSIHCKVSYNGQIRRFALDGTEFTSLKETIARLLSLNDEFVLKYRDDESDYVILESAEDLKTALTLSPKLLRILVSRKDAMVVTSNDDMSCKKKYRKRQYQHENKDHHGHHGHGNHGHHGHHGRGGHHGNHQRNDELRQERREKKLVFINQCLADLGSDDSLLSQSALHKKQRLLKKKQRLEACQRGECYNERKRRGTLTPEDEERNRSLKVQILAVKMEESKVKTRQREIKMMLQDQSSDQALRAELAALKEQKKLLKIQKRELLDQLHI
jgi:hypothetical protein